MARPRLSIGRLMMGVVLLGIPIGLAANAMNGRSLIGSQVMADLGLWPGLVAFGAASFALAERRGRGSPFLWGFATTGWAALLAYVALGTARDRVARRVGLFYWNDLGEWGFAWLTDLDLYEGYALNLLILGLVLALPQLVAATVGGLVVRRVREARWTST